MSDPRRVRVCADGHVSDVNSLLTCCGALYRGWDGRGAVCWRGVHFIRESELDVALAALRIGGVEAMLDVVTVP